MKVFVKSLLYLMLIAVFVGGLFLAFREELFQIKSVTVVSMDGSHPLLFDRVKKSVKPILGQLDGQWMWSVHLDQILKVVLNDKRVKEANIRRQLPGKVSVFIQTHQPIAVALHGGNSFYPVAGDGSLLPAVQLNEVLDTPVLRGNKLFNNQELRKKVITYLWELPKKGSFTLSNISEVSWTKDQGLKIVLQSGGAVVYMGEDDFKSKTKHVEKVLNYLIKEGMSGRVIDARFSKKVLVKLRNES